MNDGENESKTLPCTWNHALTIVAIVMFWCHPHARMLRCTYPSGDEDEAASQPSVGRSSSRKSQLPHHGPNSRSNIDISTGMGVDLGSGRGGMNGSDNKIGKTAPACSLLSRLAMQALYFGTCNIRCE